MSELTLTNFLLARIAEDERDVPHLFDVVEIVGGQFVDLRARHLAECEAKRRIVERCRASNGYWGAEVERMLAVPYADHPDYRKEWAA